MELHTLLFYFKFYVMGDYFGIGTALSGLAQAGTSVYGAERSYQAVKDTNSNNALMNFRTNQANLRAVEKTNKANREIAESNNQWNRENMELQNQWNIDQWNRENAYNSPVAQRARLIQAGINPAMSDIAGGTASQLQSAEVAPADTSGRQIPAHFESSQAIAPRFDLSSNLFESIAQGISSLSDSKRKNIESDQLLLRFPKEMEYLSEMIRKTEADTLYGQQLREYQRYMNSLFRDTYVAQVEMHSVEVAKAREEMLLTSQRIINAKSENDLIIAQTGLAKAQEYAASEGVKISREQIASAFKAAVMSVNAQYYTAKVHKYGIDKDFELGQSELKQQTRHMMASFILNLESLGVQSKQAKIMADRLDFDKLQFDFNRSWKGLLFNSANSFATGLGATLPFVVGKGVSKGIGSFQKSKIPPNVTYSR